MHYEQGLISDEAESGRGLAEQIGDAPPTSKNGRGVLQEHNNSCQAGVARSALRFVSVYSRVGRISTFFENRFKTYGKSCKYIRISQLDFFWI